MSEELSTHDHRRLGRAMDLFHVQEEAAGAVFWHPKGWTLYRTIEDYIRSRLVAEGYQEVRTPILYSNRNLWEEAKGGSGHWEKFGQNIFSTGDYYREPVTDREYVTPTGLLKAMSCPPHIEIFRSGTVSYRQLPVRYAEFGTCFRNEPSGALHGIMRLRQFTQDDGHIFAAEDQILDETKRFCTLLMSVYKDFGFDKIKIGISTRPEVRAGDDATWDRAEKALMDAITACGLSYDIYPGDGAFYGPKAEWALTDLHGREWQCGTLQLDFILADRMGAQFMAQDGSRQPPVLLHRAIFGSLERFIGILLEHHNGELPNWLRPVQARVVTVKGSTIVESNGHSSSQIRARLGNSYSVNRYGEWMHEWLSDNLRVDIDDRDENLSHKVKEAFEAGIPNVIVVGPHEAQYEQITVRVRGGTDLESYPYDEGSYFLTRMCQRGE